MTSPDVAKGNRRSRWETLVMRYRAAGMTGELRALLIVLARHMDANGYVSVPQSRIAEMFGVPRTRIIERIKRAKDLGLLDTVQSGRPGVTAVYQATLPAELAGASPRTMRGPIGRRTTQGIELGTSGRTKEGTSGRTKPDGQLGTSGRVAKQRRQLGTSGRTTKTGQLGTSGRVAIGSAPQRSPDKVTDPGTTRLGFDDDFKSKSSSSTGEQTEPRPTQRCTDATLESDPTSQTARPCQHQRRTADGDCLDCHATEVA
jgi:hypothetical protein